LVTRKSTLLAVLVWTMTATSYQIFFLAVLAVDIIADLGLSRAELGFIGAINTATGALSAPFTGRLTDRIGAWMAAITGMCIGSLGMAMMALSPNAAMLSLSALISGIPQGWGNPATNALIAERVAPGARGTITGIKQSGVQFGVFLSGFTLPTLALWTGWRGSAWVYCAAFAIGAVATAVLLPRHPKGFVGAAASPPSPQPEAETLAGSGHGSQAAAADGGSVAASETGVDVETPSTVDPWIWRLAGYALLMGMAGGAVGRFFPLWAEEAIGLSTTRAGLLVALTGLLGIGARIVAGRVAEKVISPPLLLRILAGLGGVYAVMLILTPILGPWLLWPGTVFNAVGIGAWNAVAMLAIIMVVPRALAGRASGIVMFGFLGGLSISSPLTGWVVDQWGSYQPVWVACAALASLALLSLSSSPRS